MIKILKAIDPLELIQKECGPLPDSWWLWSEARKENYMRNRLKEIMENDGSLILIEEENVQEF